MAALRWRTLLPGVWAGWLLAVALLATPAPFALLPTVDAGRVVARVLAHEAYSALLLGVVMLALERVAARRNSATAGASQFSAGMALALVALFCTVAGYFAIQPMMGAAQAGQGPFSFGQLHAASAGFFLVKLAAVGALAWRGTLTRPTSS